MDKTVVAFIYDFDDTLSKGFVQDEIFIPILGCDTKTFWREKDKLAKDNKMDNILALLYTVLKISKERNLKLTKNVFFELGKSVNFFNGVLTWFDRINKFGKDLNLKIEHYIISGGMKEVIEGTAIAKKIKKIFASSYLYNEQGEAVWPSQAVNYTNKTQYLYRIRKNQLEELHDDDALNARIPEEEKLPFKKMLYFGDGSTDVPCMTIIKRGGGQSFGVFDPSEARKIEKGNNLFRDHRVNHVVPADYSEGSKLDELVKKSLINLSNEISKE